MRRTTRDSKIYTDWMIFAESDLKAASLLAKSKKTLLLSAFHSHQAIEKTLKAYILCQKGYAPDGHNVIFLCRTVMRSERDFSEWLDECIALNNYYVQTRYPPDFPLEITQKRAKELCNMAQRLYTFTLLKLARFD